MSYFGFLIGIILIYWVASLGCTLAWRIYGIPILCGAAIMGVGAYSAAIADKGGFPIVAGLIISIILGGLLGAAFGIIIDKLNREVAVIFSIVVQATATILFLNLSSITGGPMGIGRISGFILNQAAGKEWLATAFVASVVIPILWIESRAYRGEFGTVARAAGENSLLLRSFARDATTFSRLIYIMTFALFALAGGIFSHYLTYIHPDSFTLTESMLLLCMVVFGRRGGVMSTGFGVAILLIVPEALRYIHLDIASSGKIRGIFLGLILCFSAISLARSMREQPGKTA